MKIDLEKFEGTLPYASEIFGVYSPLIGWRSDRLKRKIDSDAGYLSYLAPFLNSIKPNVVFKELESNQCTMRIEISAGTLDPMFFFNNSGSILLSLIWQRRKDEENWNGHISIEDLLKKTNAALMQMFYAECNAIPPEKTKLIRNLKEKYKLKAKLESRIASFLPLIVDGNDDLTFLDKILSDHLQYQNGSSIDENGDFSNNIYESLFRKPIDYFDPKEDMKDITVSPIGLVHLFRQYFFEFDTFLGSPVEHVWLSPGSEVTLIETHTRKNIVEKSINQSFESTFKSETFEREKDEISEAIKEENNQDLSLGASVAVNQSWASGSMNASTNMGLNTTKNLAKEKSHSRMRDQSSRISSEIRKSYTSTFKSVEEITDFSSKKFSLKNTTDKLINYELRRKMRQVGVQVQDIGSYLCWQTYVDRPGKTLGLANLIHLEKPADLDGIPKPQTIETPKPSYVDHTVTLRFIPIEPDIKNYEIRPDMTYFGGEETDHGGDMYTAINNIEHIQQVSISPPESGYILDSLTLVSTNNKLCDLKIIENSDFKLGKVTLEIEKINFENMLDMQVIMKGIWVPDDELVNKINTENSKNLDDYDDAVKALSERAIVEGLKERVNNANSIEERKFEDLREEERITIYRELVDDLIKNVKSSNYSVDSNEQHVIAEMINSIFDVGKMLYFVAPDWWKPKQIWYNQGIQGANIKADFVSWGGGDRPTNYLITEGSEPVKLGSSLGWTLQLDGDNMRNAFLNAPWVKAVIPIRPGKEMDALNWLKTVEGQTGLTEKDFYKGPEEEYKGKTILEVLETLAKEVNEKHEEGRAKSEYPDSDSINDDNRVSALPIDKVYEYGFYPLEGGFRAQTKENFEIFDQWIEILPTDQIVPVEIEYDSKTGMQI